MHSIPDPVESFDSFKHNLHFISSKKNPKYTGFGMIIYPNDGDSLKCYIGEFKRGKRHGRGWRLLNETIFCGSYHKDLKHGNATIWKRSKRGYEQVFNGKYENGKVQGKCFLKDEEHVFNGMVHQGLYHGNCEIQYPNGDKFIGSMISGKMSGVGTILYANGDKYSGGFIDNQRSGKGNYVWKFERNINNLSSNLSLNDSN